ncbi:MAG: hypothetical protein SFU85_02000 [Candidatus Methylacidiphilales bacterium]|nr:hypothetical protein [Candidatus Methylacidiphilales bacterium]
MFKTDFWSGKGAVIVCAAAAALLLLSIPPHWFVLACQKPRGLERLILFGQSHEQTSLPEIRKLAPPRNSPAGYDAQYYVQMAFDPTLRHPGLTRALDSPSYRARRIFMPALVWLATWNQDPVRKIQVFALINPLCWLALLVLVARITRLQSIRDLSCLVACALGSGSLFSLTRSLTDLPSAVLGLAAVTFPGYAGNTLFSLSLLTRETACCSLLAVWKGRFHNPASWPSSLLRLTLVLLPLALWLVYIHFLYRAHGSLVGSGNFALPLTAVWPALSEFWASFAKHPSLYGLLTLSIPFCLFVQSLYLALNLKKHQDDPFWRMGIGFALLLLVLGPAVWAEARTVCRVVLPLTLAFNLLIRHEKPPSFSLWFLAGNIGLFSELVGMNQIIGGAIPGITP